MKNVINKLILMAFAMVVLVAATPVATKAAPYVSESFTAYYQGYESSGSIYIGNLKKDSKITSVKSSNTKVAVPTTKSFTAYTSTAIAKNYSNYKDYYGYVNFSYKKAGKATLSFKVDGKTYKVKVTINKYTNPAKSIKINGTEVASKFDKKGSVEVKKIKKNVKNAKITAKAKSGWKITSINIYDQKDYHTANINNYSNGVQGRTLIVDKLTKGHPYTVSVSFSNTKQGGSLTLNYLMVK